MIIKWNENRVKVVPNLNGGKAIVLLPGHNEVHAKDWKSVRVHVEGDIASGRVVEVEAVVETAPVDPKDKDPQPKKVLKSAKAFKDLEPEEALKIVGETYSLETLEAWRKASSKDEIRAAISEQIKLVNEKGSKPTGEAK